MKQHSNVAVVKLDHARHLVIRQRYVGEGENGDPAETDPSEDGIPFRLVTIMVHLRVSSAPPRVSID
jgi:hypothetical protein